MASRLNQFGQQGNFMRSTRTKIQSGQFKVVLLDIPSKEESKIADLTPRETLAVRITEGDVLCRKETIRALRGIVRAC
eukprot:9085072-Pyramimonas_sp.AAC.1